MPDGSVFAPPEKRQKATAAGACSSTVIERETDPTRLAQRQKQIDFGKNTLAYERYARDVPRRSRTVDLPWTPDIGDPMAKRRFDGKVKQWRRDLHEWENANPEKPSAASEEAAKPLGLAGLAANAVSFDDFLDDQLDCDDDDEAVVADSAPAQPPATTSSTTCPAAAEVAPAEAPPAISTTASSLRQRLDLFKTNKQPSPAAQTGSSIFGTFDDAGLV